MVGGTGVKSDLLSQPKEIPMYYESGTPNVIAISALYAGLDFIANTGIGHIHLIKTMLTNG